MTTTAHNRFDEAHRALCDDCQRAYEDFCQEQADEARLDSMAENSADDVE